jgi:putative flavoprotein involved in K+ transport
MKVNQVLDGTTPHEAVTGWLTAFERAARGGDPAALHPLFNADSHWRDLLAFTWHIETRSGVDAIVDAFARTLSATRPRDFRIAPGREAPRVVTRAGVETIEAIVAFDTAIGTCSGVLRLVPCPDGEKTLRAWVLLTALDDIRGHEQRIGKHRPRGEEYSGGFGSENWLDDRSKAAAYEDHDPAVLVVGGSQSGLGIAACLGVLGVDTLVIDRHARIGDAWRKRYHNLVLHNEVYVNHLPYMQLPPSWPVYIPKDKLANWFESYADAMELNCWTGTELVRGCYDEAAGRWEIELRRSGVPDRTLRPRHIVFATGVSAIPIRPDLAGLEDFAGEVMHSGDYQNGRAWAGKPAIVLGTGNSGHDVAHDLHACGADVTLMQRNSTLIVSLKQAQVVYDMYHEGASLEDCDLIATASPYPVLVQGYKLAAAATKEADKELLQGLQARGFKLDYGPPDDTGYQMKYLRRGGGYYFNVGCSDLIVAGKIKLRHFDEIDRFVAGGALLRDGSVLEADLLVTATGYENQQEVVRLYMGDRMADRIGPVWGFGVDGEQRNMWRRTPQPGLWFTAGGLPHVRIYSKYLAMQIKACEEGLITLQRPATDGERASRPSRRDQALAGAR